MISMSEEQELMLAARQAERARTLADVVAYGREYVVENAGSPVPPTHVTIFIRRLSRDFARWCEERDAKGKAR